eukprot:1041592-Pyramimonas_sp.AAC.1
MLWMLRLYLSPFAGASRCAERVLALLTPLFPRRTFLRGRRANAPAGGMRGAGLREYIVSQWTRCARG